MNPRRRVLLVMGTRPDAIKLSPIYRRLVEDGALDVVLVSTGQHRELLADAPELFGRPPDHDLKSHRQTQGLGTLLSAILQGVESIVALERPDLVLVQGDTTSALGASLAAASLQVPIGHVEAGLRTHRRNEPFPEEMNRRQIAVLAELHFAPTQRAVTNLLREGVSRSQIFLTGNTVVDALMWAYSRQDGVRNGALAELLPSTGRLVLATVHRRENWDTGIESVCEALRLIAAEHADVRIVFPVHPNPRIRKTVERLLGGLRAVALVPPLPHKIFLECLAHAACVLTDSGGVQEEAPSFGTPVVVLRRVTERPEAVDAGSSVLAGLETHRIVAAVREQLARPVIRNLGPRRPGSAGLLHRSPYGDGGAAARIATHIYAFLGESTSSHRVAVPVVNLDPIAVDARSADGLSENG